MGEMGKIVEDQVNGNRATCFLERMHGMLGRKQVKGGSKWLVTNQQFLPIPRASGYQMPGAEPDVCEDNTLHVKKNKKASWRMIEARKRLQ